MLFELFKMSLPNLCVLWALFNVKFVLEYPDIFGPNNVCSIEGLIQHVFVVYCAFSSFVHISFIEPERSKLEVEEAAAEHCYTQQRIFNVVLLGLYEACDFVNVAVPSL
jgi:hypothetical protein